MDVYVEGQKLRLTPKNALGKGGEADIFKIGKDQALKLFKPPEHPDYQACQSAQKAARDRLAEHQQKLRQFPTALPQRVIQPTHLVTDKSGKTLLGYTMPLVQGAEVLSRYSDRGFRQTGIAAQTVVEILQDLHTTVKHIHQAGVVIGDFNDFNVLVKDTAAYVIDADSFQYGPFECKVFTSRFVDPLLCDPQAGRPLLLQAYSAHSDWYAFAVMVMQSLLLVDPYGGVYKPANPGSHLPHEARPLHRITVFHPEVKYPKPAIPYTVLPDDLLHYLHQVFEKDYRLEFPSGLLQNLHWHTCPTCGKEHARSLCPTCAPLNPGGVTQVIRVRGTVTATEIFRTEGTIVQAALQSGKLVWLSCDRGTFQRETGTVVFKGTLEPDLKFRFLGSKTLVGKSEQVVTFAPGQTPEVLAVDASGSLALFETNEKGRYWLHRGQLLRDGTLGPVYIGDVLEGQTQFWVGENFGFGFYRAGLVQVAFVFDAQRSGIHDSVALPRWQGQLRAATCVFSHSRCWFFVALQEQGQTLHRCWIIRPDGAIEASAEAIAGDGSWLSSLQGKFAAVNFLLAATDEGIVRVEPRQGQIVVAKTFPDTEPFVDASCRLLASAEGLYVISQNRIQHLSLS